MSVALAAYTLKRAGQPDDEPVTLAEAKLQCRIDADLTEDDTLLTALIQAARESVEEELRRCLVSTSWTLGLDAFPDGDRFGLPRPPLRSVTSVKYYSTDGVLTTVSTTVYGVDTQSEPGQVYLKSGQSWPAVDTRPNAVVITFVAGAATTEDVPAGIKQMVLWLIGHMYEQREASIEKALSPIPLGFERLIWLYRLPEMV